MVHQSQNMAAVKQDQLKKRITKGRFHCQFVSKFVVRFYAQMCIGRKMVVWCVNHQMITVVISARKSNSAADSRRNALMKEVLFNHSQVDIFITLSVEP